MNFHSISIQIPAARLALVRVIYPQIYLVCSRTFPGWGQFTIKGGERSSSATSYLAPEFAKRPNLHVLVNTRVSRVLQSGSVHGVPSFRRVELFHSGNSREASFGLPSLANIVCAAKHIHITARKEVILSSGVIGTPTILQHSGIGDRKLLSSVGVKSLIHLPSVGQNLTDQPFVANTWLVNSTNTFETAFRNATLAQEQVRQWNETRTGPYAGSSFNIAGWLRLPNNAHIFQKFTDPSAGPNTGHYEFIIAVRRISDLNIVFHLTIECLFRMARHVSPSLLLATSWL